MAQYDETKWVGIKPTVKTAKTPAGKVTIEDSSTEILDAEENRTSILIRNTGSVNVYVNFGNVATVNDMPLEPGDVLSCDDFTGAVNGIVASGTGEIRLIEV